MKYEKGDKVLVYGVIGYSDKDIYAVNIPLSTNDLKTVIVDEDVIEKFPVVETQKVEMILNYIKEMLKSDLFTKGDVCARVDRYIDTIDQLSINE